MAMLEKWGSCIEQKPEDTVQDIGVQRSAKRSLKVMKERLRKAKARNKGVKVLSKFPLRLEICLEHGFFPNLSMDIDAQAFPPVCSRILTGWPLVVSPNQGSGLVVLVCCPKI